MKGSERNSKCTCGSGLKRKRCEPTHPPTEAEMNELHEQALLDDRWRDPEYRRQAKRKMQQIVLLTSAITGGVF